MIHPWEQPIRPLEVHPNVNKTGTWYPVLFIRPWEDGGWEVISAGGHVYDNDDAMLRVVDLCVKAPRGPLYGN